MVVTDWLSNVKPQFQCEHTQIHFSSFSVWVSSLSIIVCLGKPKPLFIQNTSKEWRTFFFCLFQSAPCWSLIMRLLQLLVRGEVCLKMPSGQLCGVLSILWHNLHKSTWGLVHVRHCSPHNLVLPLDVTVACSTSLVICYEVGLQGVILTGYKGLLYHIANPLEDAHRIMNGTKNKHSYKLLFWCGSKLNIIK